MTDGFFSGVPNEEITPRLHAITSRKMTVLQSPDVLSQCQIDKKTLSRIFSDSDENDEEMDGFGKKTELSKLQQELF